MRLFELTNLQEYAYETGNRGTKRSWYVRNADTHKIVRRSLTQSEAEELKKKLNDEYKEKELTEEEFDFEEWKAKLPPNDGDTAYVIYMSEVHPVVVQGKSDSFGGTHEVVMTSKGGHSGLLFPTFGKDLFKTERDAKKALFKQELKGYPKSNAVMAPRW